MLHDLAQVIVVIGQILIEVDHGLVAFRLDLLTEGVRHAAHRLCVRDLLGAGTGVILPLPVKDHRVGDGVGCDLLQHISGLLPGLLHGDRLGEVVHPHLEPGIQRTLDIALEIGVTHHLALAAIAPVSHPDHGKLDAGVGHLGPVDLPLVDGHIHAAGHIHPVFLIVHHAVFPPKSLRIIGVHRHIRQDVVVGSLEGDLLSVAVDPVHLPDDDADLSPGDRLVRQKDRLSLLLAASDDPQLVQGSQFTVIHIRKWGFPLRGLQFQRPGGQLSDQFPPNGRV